jgi:ABC-type sugar transport system ATPase subunit
MTGNSSHLDGRERGEQASGLLPGSAADRQTGEGPTPGTVVSLRAISKTYPGVRALTSVDLDLLPGEVHAIAGENGAGKSTLLKIIAGIESPDGGAIYVNGERATIRSPREARVTYGISAVPQELSLVPHLTVADNICSAALPARMGMVSKRMLRGRATAVLDSLGLDIDPFSQLSEHGPGVQQLVMIGRGLAQEARVLMLDEPTAALTAPEIEHLFEVITAATKQGKAFLYISHRLEELSRIANTLTVLRDGERVVTAPMAEFDHDQIVGAMVGRAVDAFVKRQGHYATAGPADGAEAPPRLRVDGLTRHGVFEDISFSIGRGEIVGFAGLMGAGRTEIARAIFGVDRADSGTVEVDGRSIHTRSPRAAIDAGIAMVPEERKAQGLVLGMSVEDNLTAAHLGMLSRGGFLRRRRSIREAKRQVDRLGVNPRRINVPVGSLSGGNQQKVVIGRWLVGDHSIYLFDEPTRGVDINAKFAIYDILLELREAGAALLVISSELLELLAICDRILVIREGRLANELHVDESLTEEEILRSALAPQPATA